MQSFNQSAINEFKVNGGKNTVPYFMVVWIILPALGIALFIWLSSIYPEAMDRILAGHRRGYRSTETFIIGLFLVVPSIIAYFGFMLQKKIEIHGDFIREKRLFGFHIDYRKKAIKSIVPDMAGDHEVGFMIVDFKDNSILYNYTEKEDGIRIKELLSGYKYPIKK